MLAVEPVGSSLLSCFEGSCKLFPLNGTATKGQGGARAPAKMVAGGRCFFAREHAAGKGRQKGGIR